MKGPKGIVGPIRRFLGGVLGRISGRNRGIPEYASFAAALSAGQSRGYDSDLFSQIRVQGMQEKLEKTNPQDHATIESFDQSLLATLFMLAPGKKRLSILDFGGGNGRHYFFARRLLPPDLALQWVVVDTPAMVKAAKVLENEELSFFDGLEAGFAACREPDLFYSSRTLQCLPEPLEGLKSILSYRPAHLHFAALNLISADTGDKQIVITERMPLKAYVHSQLPDNIRDAIVEFPITFIDQESFLRELTACYRVLWAVQDKAPDIMKISGRFIKLLHMSYVARKTAAPCQDPQAG